MGHVGCNKCHVANKQWVYMWILRFLFPHSDVKESRPKISCSRESRPKQFNQLRESRPDNIKINLKYKNLKKN